MKRALGFTVLAAVTFVAVGWGLWRLSGSREHQLVGELVTRVETTEPLVALTFDDGPIPGWTDTVLTILNEHEARATFFMVGDAVARAPEVVERVMGAGHEVANHSWSHRPLMLRAPGAIRREIVATDSILRALGWKGPIYVRPPYAKRLVVLPWLLHRDHRPVVLWDLEPDTFHRDADGMVDYVRRNVRPGSIILLHAEISTRTEGRRALPRILQALDSAGYRVVPLGQLLETIPAPEGVPNA